VNPARIVPIVLIGLALGFAAYLFGGVVMLIVGVTYALMVMAYTAWKGHERST
jgi:hypothetical protein